MRKIIGLLIVMAVAAGGAPGTAVALPGACKQAGKARRAVVGLYGARAAGRDVCRYGVRAQVVWRAPGYVSPRFYAPTRREARQYLAALRDLKRPVYSMVKRPALPRRAPAGTASYRLVPVGTASCIVAHESRGNPQASNGSHWGLAQWTIEAWTRHGGGRFASSPLRATEQQQLHVLSRGLRFFGCRDWCPFDGC